MEVDGKRSMPTLAERLPGLQERLDALLVEHDVPGATLAILDVRAGETLALASGVTSVETGLAVTPDTFFTLWSISKVYTTTLVMQLVDQGLVDLDAPVNRYVPDFRPGVPPASAITVRQLLTHTSGLLWDMQQDFGRGDDAIARCVAAMRAAPVPYFSYCNAGFTAAGAVIERVTGQVWDTALRTRLLDPLGLQQTLTFAEDLLQRRVAAQHRPDPETGKQTVQGMYPIPRAYGPAGTSLHVTAPDLLGFAALHLRQGRAPDGATVLSEESVRAMQAHAQDLPFPATTGSATNAGWGLGWQRFELAGRPAVGHGGGTSNILRLFPDDGLAFALLSNGMRGNQVAETLLTEALTALLGIQPPAPQPPPPAADVPADLSAYTGHYTGTDLALDVLVRDGRLFARSAASEARGPLHEFPLHLQDRATFELPGAGRGGFLDFAGETPRYLHFGLRTLERESDIALPAPYPTQTSAGPTALERDERLISNALKIRYNPLVVARGDGARLWDTAGREYLDFGAGWSLAHLGYSNTHVREAVRRQMEQTTFAGLISASNLPALDLAEKLVELMPGDFEKKVWFGLSGSDAAEAAQRLLRIATGKSRFISFIGSWHGTTEAAMALSGHPAFASTTSGQITKVPYPNPYRNPFGGDAGQVTDQCLSYLEDYLFRTVCPPADVAAVFVETVQSDAGDIVPPPDFVPKLRALCDRHNILLVVDDIKVGLGRTGKMFSYEHAGIVPDLVLLGKSLGGGLPLSAIVGRREVLDAATGAALFTTVGNATCCAAGLATIETIEREGLVQRAAENGAYLQQCLHEALGDLAITGDVRGLGMIQGVELVQDLQTKEPNQPAAARIVYRAWELGLVVYYAGSWANVLEITPPLVLTRAEIERGVAILRQAFEDTLAGRVDEDAVARFAGW